MRTRTLCCHWSGVGSPGSRATSLCTCQVLRPRRAVRALALPCPYVLPSAFATASTPRVGIFTRLNGWPMHSPTDASPPSLRTATHGLGPIGSLLLHRIGLAPTAHCRSPGALRKILYVICL